MSHHRRFLWGWIVAAMMLVTQIGQAPAQIPDEFTNLKVLPKDIGKRKLVQTMRGFASALGKRCNYCHVGEDPNSLEGYDFSSDEKEKKRIARLMMQMTAEINNRFIPEVGHEFPIEVRCVTCHRGIDEPESMDRVMLDVIEDDGVTGASDKYRELRDEYYGKGSYNFSAGALNEVAETLGRRDKDLDGAIAMMKLNLEFHPEAAYSHLLLGQFYAARGDKDAAISSIEQAIELEPDNEWAKRLLERIRASD